MSLAQSPSSHTIPPLDFPLDSERLWEVINDQEVELPIMGVYEGLIASRLNRKVGNFAEDQNLGHVVTEVLFRLDPEKTTMRRPDVAFVSFERWSQDQAIPAGNGWRVVPDLTVEIVSPTDIADEVMTKVFEYLAAGVSLVWVIYPRNRRVVIFNAANNCQVINPDGQLDGVDILPGFQISLAELFRYGPKA